jgi:hypothetical protein
MARVVRFGLALVVASSFWLAPAVSAAAASPSSQTIKMDTATCGSMLTALRGVRLSLSPANQYVVDHAGTGDCRVTSSSGNVRPTSTADVLAGCSGYWSTFRYTVYFGNWGFDYLQDHLNGGFCSNGTTVTRDWGPDCYVTTLAVWGSGTDWCGNYRPQGSGSLQMGHNFHIFPYPAPWWNKYGYSRTQVNPDLGYSNWGACCA